MNDTTGPTREHAEVTVTITVGDVTQTWTADTTTTGSPYKAVRQLLIAVKEDASDWTFARERN